MRPREKLGVTGLSALDDQELVALVLGHGVRGWLFAAMALFAPLPMLFHRPFVVNIVLPFMHAIGAI